MGADAFSADIETASEGTYLTARRVRYYLSLVRSIAGDRPVIATVPRPTSYWLAHYPYGAEAPFVDAYAPMVYWSCTEPGAAVDQAIVALSKMRPVAPIGQDYNIGPGGRSSWAAVAEGDLAFPGRCPPHGRLGSEPVRPRVRRPASVAGARRISVGTEGNARSSSRKSPPLTNPKGDYCPCRRRPTYT